MTAIHCSLRSSRRDAWRTPGVALSKLQLLLLLLSARARCYPRADLALLCGLSVLPRQLLYLARTAAAAADAARIIILSLSRRPLCTCPLRSRCTAQTYVYIGVLSALALCTYALLFFRAGRVFRARGKKCAHCGDCWERAYDGRVPEAWIFVAGAWNRRVAKWCVAYKV